MRGPHLRGCLDGDDQVFLYPLNSVHFPVLFKRRLRLLSWKPFPGQRAESTCQGGGNGSRPYCRCPRCGICLEAQRCHELIEKVVDVVLQRAMSFLDIKKNVLPVCVRGKGPACVHSGLAMLKQLLSPGHSSQNGACMADCVLVDERHCNSRGGSFAGGNMHPWVGAQLKGPNRTLSPGHAVSMRR